MGSSGGTPSIGRGQGFFPAMPQLNMMAFRPWDMSALGQTMGLPSFEGLFGPPQQAQPPPPQLMQQPPRRDQAAYQPGGYMSPFSASSNSGGGYQFRRR